ncbi:unnamed protein product [Plutella xylostella]|uniref:(diamondback moth) hypothetical protein n=1 Tax=Plutella xylostella TaxID=51655 RepID=A0A8S4DIC7_PLUXY|nr:unnamed protein product [Plutella xylostella]
MADIKSMLKEARKLVDEKNFKEAQECCKNILRKDKQNYLALVLLGKSLQDAEQAPLAYQKAIACKPDQPLAWQGLANYYERQNGSTGTNKLLSTYAEILKLQIDTEKALEVVSKVGQLGSSMKENECLGILLDYVQNNTLESKVKGTAEFQIKEMLKHGVKCDQGQIPIVLNILNEMMTQNPNEIELLYVKVIFQRENFVEAAEEVINLHFFPNNPVVREWICNELCKKFVETESFEGLDIQKHVDIIIKGIETSKPASLLKSMICYEQSNYLDAYKLCVPLVNYVQPNIIEATFIIRCSIKLKNWPITQKLAMNFLTKVIDDQFSMQLKKYLLFSLAKQQKWEHALSAVKGLPFEGLDTGEQALFAECQIQLHKDASAAVDKLQGTTYYLPLQALQLLKQNKYSEVIKLLEEPHTDPICLFFLGKAHWELKQYELCHLNLLKSAKLNPEHSDTFLYLGHFYRYHIQDLEKAKKCYEKANNLNGYDSEIVKNLSEIYTDLGQRENDYGLLTKAVEKHDVNEGWIHFRIGLHHLSKRDWENAIIYFRNVIKQEQNNSTALECLADAYFSRGSYVSALRAYHRVIELNPTKALHCLTRIGYIHSLLTQYEDAIATFRKVLLMDASSILALKGIAETWMRIAKKKVAAKLFGAARDCAQQAVDYVSKALSQNKNYACLWKILGDTLMFMTKFPTKYAFVYFNSTFKNDNKDNSDKKGKLDIFPQAIACYSLIAKQKQQSTSYDLASAYLEYYKQSSKDVNGCVAFNLTIASIKKKPYLWRNWDLLGKICWNMKKYSLAQHCFIKALSLTRKWSVAKIWCNLGTLYVKLKHYKIANYCYWRGQSTLPSYPQSWIGQGLIAEQIREEEAMDLFRHACRLGYHQECALGYADWVCRTLKKSNTDTADFKYVIEGLHAIPYAMDLIEWYSCFEPESAFACTVQGILQERSGLLEATYKSYEKAFRYAPDDKKNITLLNMGRILLRLHKYEEAILVYKAITEASLNSACGLALALFKKGLYEESYSAYDTALHWLSNNDADKADLLVAMAGIMYMFKGLDDAKTILFHSIQVAQQKPTANSLFSICALGLIHTDDSLSKLAVSELKKYEKDEKLSTDIGFLKSYLLLCEVGVERAIKCLSETLHDHPSNAMLWFFLAQYCLRDGYRARVASCSAQRALCAARAHNHTAESPKILATASIAEHLAGNKLKALTLAKQGLHMYPQTAEIWAALLFSMQSNIEFVEKKKWMIGAAGHMRSQLEISAPLSKWAGVLEKKLTAA